MLQKSVPRNKTFTGCWTCRFRGIKCDDTRPTCTRCRKRRVVCEGYGIRLVWEGCGMNPKSTRRSIFDGSEKYLRISGSNLIESMIDTLDKRLASNYITTGSFGARSGPFSVFTAQPCLPDVDTAGFETTNHIGPSPTKLLTTSCAPKSEAALSISSERGLLEPSGTSPFGHFRPDKLPGDNPISQLVDSGRDFSGILDYTPTPRVLNQSSLFIHPRLSHPKHGPLLYHWINYMSDMMLPIKLNDNLYRTAFVPMVLSEPKTYLQEAAQNSLLHMLCALAAHNRAYKVGLSDPDAEKERGFEYQLKGIRFLSQALNGPKKRNKEDFEMILGSIILFVMVSLFSEDDGAWRVHLRCGRQFLSGYQPLVTEASGNTSLSRMLQLFLFMEEIGPSPSKPGREITLQTRETIFADLPEDFCQDDIFGLTALNFPMIHHASLTRPLFEALVLINQILSSKLKPSEKIVGDIEVKILLNNPASLNFPFQNKNDANIMRRNSCVFFFATLIYFRRYIQLWPVCDIQHLVEHCIEHIENIEKLSDGAPACGWLWPVFVTACEASSENMRLRFLRWFEKGPTLGLRNITCAKEVVEEVWRRRDGAEGGVESNIAWFTVMRDMKRDILLI